MSENAHRFNRIDVRCKVSDGLTRHQTLLSSPAHACILQPVVSNNVRVLFDSFLLEALCVYEVATTLRGH